VSLPDGAVISFGTTLGTSKTMSAISNAAEAVATLEASHGVVENDILIVTSGWSRLNGRVVRADSVSTNDVTFEDINTASTTNYPAGSGTGSVIEVTAWTQITQVTNAAFSGGEQQFVSYRFLEDSIERQIPTQKSAMSLTLTVADDQSLAHYAELVTADESRTAKAVRIVLPSGAILYFPAIITFNPNPTLSLGEIMGNQVTMSLQAAMTRYAS
jgi:hypothetical protein